MNTALLAKHSSKSNEHYSPLVIVEKARRVMGSIDLDPASCPIANQVVKANKIYTIEDNGLEQFWSGNVFLNPPGGKTKNVSNQAIWWMELINEFLMGWVDQAVFVGFSIEMLQTVQQTPGYCSPNHHPMSYSICFPSRRISFRDESGEEQKSPPHANFISFLSRDEEAKQRFFNEFTELGVTYVK